MFKRAKLVVGITLLTMVSAAVSANPNFITCPRCHQAGVAGDVLFHEDTGVLDLTIYHHKSTAHIVNFVEKK